MIESRIMFLSRLLILPLIPLFLLPGLSAAEPQTRPTEGISSMTIQEAQAMARKIMPEVEEIRGLKFKHDVPVRVVDDAQARAYFKSRLDKFWPQAQMRTEQTAYIQLGLLPAGADMEAALFSLLEEQAGGFYDPASGTFFVLGDMPRSSAPLFMAHELTHALDDQHYGIDAMITKTRDDQDRASGVSAVVEGSGMLVMTLFLSREMIAGRLTSEAMEELGRSEAGRAEKLKASPPLLQRGLLAPYMLGQSFILRGDVSRITLGAPSADLDRLFRDPPVSSEQLLHPEKYWNDTKRDLPREVRLPDLCGMLGAGWSQAGRGDLGEMTLAILTGPGVIDPLSEQAAQASAWTNEAAAGWGGDLWSLCAAGDRHVTILATLWDTLEDAVQFDAALPATGGRRVARRADAVVLVAGDAPERAEGLAAAALNAIEPPSAGSPR